MIEMKLKESEKFEVMKNEYSTKVRNLELELGQYMEINTQMRREKETLMREKDSISNEMESIKTLKLKLNELMSLLEEEKKQRRIDSINFDNLNNNLKMEFEQENRALRETVLKLKKNLELLRMDEMKNDHSKAIIEDLRFKLRGLINENERLKMESSYKDSKLKVL